MQPNLSRVSSRRSWREGCRILSRSLGTTQPQDRKPVWERGALRVKDTTNAANRMLGEIEHLSYVDRIRQSHDPTLHLKTLEDELKSTIGQALRKQADKILAEVANMEREFETYVKILQQARHHASQESKSSSSETARERIIVSCLETRRRIEEIVERHNGHRTRAMQARWELIVHRQAAGFLVNNHDVVTRTFPIKSALPEPCWEDEGGLEHARASTEGSTQRNESTQRIPDQLDWWQRIGRWR